MARPQDVLGQFSATLHSLYRSAYEMPSREFHPAAMKLVRPLFGFDSGIWASGIDSTRVLARYLHNQPLAFVEGYLQVGKNDSTLPEMLARPGIPVRCNVDARYPVAETGKAAIRHHFLRYEICNALMVGSTSGGSPLLDWIVLWRRKRDAQYSLEEASLLSAIWPHLSQALEVNRRVNAIHLYAREESGRSALAIVDRQGEVCLAAPEFGALVREEWPCWEGPSLPPRAVEALAVRGLLVYRGGNVQFESQRSEELFVVRVRRLDPMDRLSDRERDVAVRFSAGASHKEIARALAIAPSTVRNRLQDVYRKVDVSDKAELATLIASHRNVL